MPLKQTPNAMARRTKTRADPPEDFTKPPRVKEEGAGPPEEGAGPPEEAGGTLPARRLYVVLRAGGVHAAGDRRETSQHTGHVNTGSR
ncbi:hypothetical protein EYF80_065428 [Liparis tanakae]|uniref:Uncharacterized protein n=1 Tax=Liparis tanakae TaxID=230148 RepID=A0A4Z2E6R4_9TELE|nr:hypothetical protein EYF80_065428 [Liparis tanakae]